MMHSKVRWGLVASLFALSATVAEPAQAQLSDVRMRLHGGIVKPLAATSDYFSFGPSVGFDAGMPLNERLAVHLEIDWNYLNTTRYYNTPVTNLWGYRAEVEADVLGDSGSGPLLHVFGGAGATTVHSHKFWLLSREPQTFDGERLRQTSLTATGGVRLGLRTPDGNTWWLSGKLLWMPLNDLNQDALTELTTNQANPGGLSPLGSALNASITLGIGL